MLIGKHEFSTDTTTAATAGEIETVASLFGSSLPVDYVDLLNHADGFSGQVKNVDPPHLSTYVSFYSARQVTSHNQTLEVAEFEPGLMLVGSNGGETGFFLRRPAGPGDDPGWVEMSCYEIGEPDAQRRDFETLSDLLTAWIADMNDE